jgi:hypothetical protein
MENNKNIWLLPTNEPSRFSLNSSGKYHLTNQLYTNSPNFTNQNIYITSDEEIKEGDWVINIFTNKISFIYNIIAYNADNKNKIIWKKIILTTDQDLIKDGVQAIPDEFLEWFVKNSSCERVEVVNDEYVDLEKDEYVDLYKIIIPKEEPKQGTMSEAIKQVINNQLKQETLEEAAKSHAIYELENNYKPTKESFKLACKRNFIRGAKWNKNKYSEEDMQEYAEYCTSHVLKSQVGYPYLSATKWFEQFKKNSYGK